MVTAELSYNPYLREIKVKFNGREPHINSLIEKYQDVRLEDWVDKAPDIFREEMNGYDFELAFSGPLLDYEELQKSFAEKGLPEGTVRFSHKKEIEDRETKIKEIKAVLQWLDKNRSSTFDFHAFQSENSEIFNVNYFIVLFHGDGLEISGEKSERVSFESVNASDELKTSDLSGVPVVYVIDRNSMSSLQEDIKFLRDRPDVRKNQLFFLMNRNIPEEVMKRTIEDLGIANPTIIEEIQDCSLKRYCQLYPVTDYICLTIKKLQNVADRLKEQEEVAKHRHEEANKEIYKKLDELDGAIRNLKTAYSQFESRDNINVSDSWLELEQKLTDSILNWKIKKIKTSSEKEASQVAVELNEKIHKDYNDFLSSLEKAAKNYADRYTDFYKSLYTVGGQDLNYIPDLPPMDFHGENTIPDITERLLALKTEAYATPKDDLFGSFFRSQSQEEKQAVPESTYFFQEWRNACLNTVKPEAEKLMNRLLGNIRRHFEMAAKEYQNHISMLIENYSEKKNQVSMQLSDDEQKFQEDVNWLADFRDQLMKIERG